METLLAYGILWVFLASVVGVLSAFLGRNSASFTAISLFLSPLVGMLALAFAGKNFKDTKPESL